MFPVVPSLYYLARVAALGAKGTSRPRNSKKDNRRLAKGLVRCTPPWGARDSGIAHEQLETSGCLVATEGRGSRFGMDLAAGHTPEERNKAG